MNRKTKHKIVAVSYINTYPFIFGLKNSQVASDNFDIELAVPSECARKLKENKADIGLIPVGALPDFHDFSIVSDYCIGANGKVKTVLLLSQEPLEKIKKIYLDTDSRTSVNLVKILAKSHWKITPDWESLATWNSSEQPESVVLIGDKTFGITDKFKYVYDLAEEWKFFTGLPFVFAVWVSKKILDKTTIQSLNNAFELGLNNLNKIYSSNLPISQPEFIDYLENMIDFNFDDGKKEALSRFTSLMKNL